MSLNETALTRLQHLRLLAPAGTLSLAEVLELFELENAATFNPWGEVVAVLSTFPHYLATYPQLISPFITALHQAAKGAFKGYKSVMDLRELLASKAYVDDNLGKALATFPAEFERAILEATA